jgi:hypothetical protein
MDFQQIAWGNGLLLSVMSLIFLGFSILFHYFKQNYCDCWKKIGTIVSK